MPTLKMVAQALLSLSLLSCAAESDTWTRGTAKACDSCTSDLDCAAGLLCDQDSFACKSVEQLKAKKPGQSTDQNPVCDADCWSRCADLGACHVVTAYYTQGDGTKKPYQTCSPKSDADCLGSLTCKVNKDCKYVKEDQNGTGSCKQI